MVSLSCIIIYDSVQVGKDQSVMKIEDIGLDPNPPQKGEPVTVSVNAKLCKSETIHCKNRV